MIPWHLCLSVRGGVVGGGYFSFNPLTTPPPKFRLYLWYPDIYVWVSRVGWWWGGLFFIQPPTTPPPKFKSCLWYPNIYVWVSGVGWWGVYKKWKKNCRFKTECWALPTFKWYPWYPDIYVWVLGVGSHHIYKINFNKYVILIKIILHFWFFQNKAVPSADM